MAKLFLFLISFQAQYLCDKKDRWGYSVLLTPMTLTDYITISASILPCSALVPLIKKDPKTNINLSVWVVFLACSWLSALGTLFSGQNVMAAIYLMIYATMLIPVIAVNLRRGGWEKLPAWHKVCAGLLPIGAFFGVVSGGDAALWVSCVVSVLLTVQLLESISAGIVRENLLTWGLFLVANSTVLALNWPQATIALRTFFFLLVFQCAAVLFLQRRQNCLGQGGGEMKNHALPCLREEPSRPTARGGCILPARDEDGYGGALGWVLVAVLMYFLLLALFG